MHCNSGAPPDSSAKNTKWRRCGGEEIIKSPDPLQKAFPTSVQDLECNSLSPAYRTGLGIGWGAGNLTIRCTPLETHSETAETMVCARFSNELERAKTLRRTTFSARRPYWPLGPTPLETHSGNAKTMVCARFSNGFSFEYLAQNNGFEEVELKGWTISRGSALGGICMITE